MRVRFSTTALLLAMLSITALLIPVSALADPSPAPESSSQLITVNAPTDSSTTATVTAWQRGQDGVWRVAIGPVPAMVGDAGIGHASEGSDRTPAGTFPLTQAFGRQPDPGTRMPYFRTDVLDWWDENPASPTYNEHVRQAIGPGGASENLYRSGSVYDYVVNMDYNVARVPGAGSAFFLHVSDGTPTAGCVSVARSVMIAILRWLDPTQHPYISIRVGAAWTAPPPRAPVGRADVIRSTALKQLTVAGWAFDLASSTAQISVRVSGPAGSAVTTTRTGLARPDVARAYSWAGPHTGFRVVVGAQGLGQNLVCVSIIPVAAVPRTVSVVCHHVLVQNEFGRLDAVTASGAAITAAGWAVNPNNPASRVAIRIFDTGGVSQVVGDTRAAGPRPDVSHAYPEFDDFHGYRIVIRAKSPGPHTICAVAEPEYGGWSGQLLGCKSATVG